MISSLTTRSSLNGFRRGYTRKGFTLIELLVVISIIALLIALLLPALAQAKGDAEATACAANEHAMGEAIQEYMQTWHGYYPGNEVVDGPTGFANDFCVWVPRLMTMMGPGSAKLFYCPARTIDMQYMGYMWPLGTSPTPPIGYGRGSVLMGFGYQKGQQVLYLGSEWEAKQGPQLSLPSFSYGYNDWGTLGAFPVAGQEAFGEGAGGDIDASGRNQYYPQVPESAVVNPGEFIVVTDRINDATHGYPNYVYIYNSDPTRTSPPLSQTSIPGVVQYAEWPGSIHSQGSNVMWADGHVSFRLQKQLVQINPNQGGGQMNMDWNNDHQVHRPNGNGLY